MLEHESMPQLAESFELQNYGTLQSISGQQCPKREETRDQEDNMLYSSPK